MKWFLCIMILMLPVLIQAQNASTLLSMTSAIKWSTGLTWQQVKQKAKKENKYIFVDCFTTWCGPCKKMDKDVYTLDSVGNYINEGFISVRLQMDATKFDNAATKSWYKTAKSFEKEYNINAYPTLLFFTPAGEMAFRETGYKEAQDLIIAAKNAKDPSKQYHLLLQHYKKGKLDDAATRSLINTFKQLGDTINYRALRDSYFTKLHALPKEKLYTREHIQFIASIISRRSQPVFDMFYLKGSTVDKVMEKKGYAVKVVNEVIMKEIVAAVLNAALEAKKELDWNSIYKSIAKDYNSDYADRVILNAKVMWYQRSGDIMKWAIALNDKMEKYGSDTTIMGEDFMLNNYASIFFTELKDTMELNRIIGWMEGVARRSEKVTGAYFENWAYYLDTYANLLYKVGRTNEAIEWEKLAVIKGKERNVSEGVQKEIEEHLELMRQGKPTWE